MSRFFCLILFLFALNVHSTLHGQDLQRMLHFHVNAGAWTKVRDLQFTPDGNILIGATRTNSGVPVFGLCKMNANGGTSWDRNYEDPGRMAELQIFRQDKFGNIYLLGNTHTLKNYSDKLLLIKCDSAGCVIWRKQLESESQKIYATELAIDVHGNPCIYGWEANARDNYDLYLIKLDTSGNIKWSFSYDGGRNDYSKNLLADASGNLVITGSKLNADHKYEIVTIKLDPNGNTLWEQVYTGPNKSSADPVSLQLDKKGNVYLAGTADGASGAKNFLAVKYSRRGKFQWSSTYDGKAGSADFVNSACLDNKGNFYLGGYSETSSMQLAATILKYSKKGKPVWALEYTGNSGSYSCNELSTDTKGNVIFAGTWLQNQTDSRFFAAVLNNMGSIAWSYSHASEPDMHFGEQILVRSAEEFYISVQRRAPNGLWNFSSMKFSTEKHSNPSKVNSLKF